jgi:parvulin-like peptidyl-prolyl isomerase
MFRARNLLLMPVLAFVVMPCVHAQQIVDRIVAKVDTDIVLLSDVQELQRWQLFVDGKSESQQDVLNHLIDEWIVRSEAKAALFPQPSAADVQRSLEHLKRSFSSPEEYEERKKQTGLTDEGIERMVRAQLYLSNYLDTRFRASIQVSDQDIEQFYKSRIVPRAQSRGQTPPTLDAARGFIQEALVQRAINERADTWLKESRARLHVEILLDEPLK